MGSCCRFFLVLLGCSGQRPLGSALWTSSCCCMNIPGPTCIRGENGQSPKRRRTQGKTEGMLPQIQLSLLRKATIRVCMYIRISHTHTQTPKIDQYIKQQNTSINQGRSRIPARRGPPCRREDASLPSGNNAGGLSVD